MERGRGVREEQGRSDRGSEKGSKGGRETIKGGTLRRTLASIQYTAHKTTHNAALALETLVLQIKNSERV